MEDYTAIAIEHNLSQFHNKPNLATLYRVLFAPFAEIQTACHQLLTLRHLDTAQGKQLDGIGNILGIERPFTIGDGLFYFGFRGQSKALGFSQAIIRSQSLSIGSGNYRYMSDNLYKRLLRWKVVKNNAHGTIEDIIQACVAVFNATKVEVIEQHCAVDVQITRKRADISEAIDSIKEQLIPVAAGIAVNVNFNNV
ncbi:DUF2612 domain-containing protein [Haemophilus parahaemolyticus]|uniref:DUF2612 domain-containing protein n=1 Tax=Haemophilus parahaemolyticus TaxID=735 RepID=UPI0028E880D4|nr:DUF2612 domain-containing protein [Haemophilus parahaemolyticus]